MAGSPAGGLTGITPASPFPSLTSLEGVEGTCHRQPVSSVAPSVIGRARGHRKEGRGAVGNCGLVQVDCGS